MGGNRYVFDKENFRFRKVTRSVGHTALRIVRIFIGSATLALLAYLVLSLFVSTDTEKQLALENRMYEEQYAALQERQQLLSDVMKDLSLRDDAIYGELFHTQAPDLVAERPVDFLFGNDSVPDKDIVEYTALKLESVCRSGRSVEEGFREVFAHLAEKGRTVPPMTLPVDGVGYAQTGASVGSKFSPFYKVMVPHGGLDLIAAQGQAVRAAAPGAVRSVEHSPRGLGNVVEIDHGNGIVTRYGHLADIVVSRGQRVPLGKRIGSVGVSGNSFAPHLHYEVIRDGRPADPVNYLFASVTPEMYTDMAYMSASTAQSLD